MAGVSACVQLCGQVVKAIDCQLNDHRFESKKHNFLHLAPNPGPLSSKIINLGLVGKGQDHWLYLIPLRYR